MVFEQPWMNISGLGKIALENIKLALNASRKVMVLHEFSQSEVYDPVLDFPLPGKVLKMLQVLQNNGNINGFMDFWGNHGAGCNVNNIAMHNYFQHPEHSIETLLRKTSAQVTGIPEDDSLNEKLVELWEKIEDATDQQAYFSWYQRFNPAIGRLGARGHFYKPLIPAFIDIDNRPPALFVQCVKSWINENLLASFAKSQIEDMQIFSELAGDSESLAGKLKDAGKDNAYTFVYIQALILNLYASLLGSIGRMLYTIDYYACCNSDALRKCISDEIAARQQQIDISLHLDYGINVEIVREDINLMRQYISSPDFPKTSSDKFKITATNYVN